MTEEHLDKFNISSSGELELKHDHESRVLQTDSLGEKEHWSSDGLYRHFLKLEDLVPRKVSILYVESGAFHKSPSTERSCGAPVD